MAKPTKISETKVTRITASDSKPVKATTLVKKSVEQVDEATSHRTPRIKNPFAPFWRYIKGSWYELRQVRWPDRRATWSMTGALLAFTLFFGVVILLLDAGFSELFKLIMGK